MDTPTVGSITQLTETGHITMYPKLERREWVFGTEPDPRDARIAQLEAALRDIKFSCELVEMYTAGKLAGAISIADAALMPFPERDMTMAQEELGA